MNKVLALTVKSSVLFMGLFCSFQGYAVDITDSQLITELKSLLVETDERLGIYAINLANGHEIQYHADNRFPTGCTSKVIGVSAILHNSQSNPQLLSTHVNYSERDLKIAGYTPITQQYLDTGMTIAELCSASISYSDNAAMNLLLKFIGGTEGMNAFAREIDDNIFRQDHDWPAEAFSGGKDNVLDSSTPKAMIKSLNQLVFGTVLDRPQRDLLTTWLVNTTTGQNRVKAGVPKNWIVGHKTGTGSYGTTNDVAILWPPKHAPILIGIYYSTDRNTADNREDIISKATTRLIEAFKKQDASLK